MKTKSKKTTLWLCVTAVFMGMNVALCTFSIPVPGGHLYLNDVLIATAALLFDPLAAFLIGGVGAFLGDFFFYPAPMFVSLVTHGLQAVVISLFYRHVLKNHRVLSSAIAVTLGGIIMVVGYTLGKIYVYSTFEYAMMKLPYEIAQAVLGIVGSMVLCWALGGIKQVEKIQKKL